MSQCIYKACADLSTKLIHAHFGRAGIASIKLKNIHGVPLITSFYGFDLGSDKFRLNKHYKKLANVGDLFLALSEDMKKDLIDNGFLEEKIVIHHLGVDLNIFSPAPLNTKFSGDFIFTIVASFTERKGIHFAIKSFKMLKKYHSVKNCKLRIVGDGPYFNQLKLISNDDTDIVFINNFVSENPRAMVLEEMQNCDVFLLTSIKLPDSDKEGTPVVLMEAQACGKTCISTFHAGIPEVVLNNQTGILVPEGDIESLTSAMLHLYSNDSLRRNLGENARKHISKNFNNKIQDNKLINIYKKFI